MATTQQVNDQQTAKEAERPKSTIKPPDYPGKSDKSKEAPKTPQRDIDN